jgi:hypothetical protein
MTSVFFSNQKLRFFGILFSTVNSTNFNIKENSPFFQYLKLREKEFPCFLLSIQDLGRSFPQPDHFIVQMQMNI